MASAPAFLSTLLALLTSFLSPAIAQQPITCCPSSLNSTSLNSSLPPTGSPVVGYSPSLLISYNGSYILELGVWQESNAVTYCMAAVSSSKIKPSAQLWAANNAKPLAAASCQLKLSAEGDLSLQFDGNRTAWNTRTAGLGVQSLVLEDSGNLVLQDAQGRSVWQSFDQSPVFYVVSGMNFTTNTTLFSSAPIALNPDFSVAGNYGMRLGTHGRLFLYVNGNNSDTPFVYWSSGIETNSNSVAYATIEDGIKFYNNQSAVVGTIQPSKIPPVGTGRVILIDNPSGNLLAFYRTAAWTLFYNSSIAACEFPYLCGEFSLCDPFTAQCSCPTGFKQSTQNGSLGCQPSINFGSNTGCSTNGYTFVTLNVSFHPQMSALSPKSPEECRTSCLENCSCKAALYDSGTSSCSLFSVLQTVSKAGNSSQLLFLKIVAEGNSFKKWAVIGIVGGVVAFAVLSLLVAFCCYRKTRSRGKSGTEERFLTELPRLPPRFSYRDLQAATKGFSIKLGAGGFGSVYDGVLPSGIRIAVKKLEGGQDQSWDQFRAEVATIGSISHVNLVTLRGFCMEGGMRLLVYEHMANGSLDKWLFGSSKGRDSSRGVLDWETRCRIALETARGLAYLHHESGEKIVHCDVKPENILLDSDMGVKVADFGLAKLVPGGHESFAMTTLKGTRGYLAPEWLQDATITPRIDVYSFGVVLLELVSGRRCLDGDIGYLPTWAMRAAAAIATLPPPTLEDGPPPAILAEEHGHDLTQLLDTRLPGSVPLASLERLVRIALWCVQSRPATRPTMATLVQMLEGVIDVPPPPLLSSPSLDTDFSSCHASHATMSTSSFPASFATTTDSSATASSSFQVHMLNSATKFEGKSSSEIPSSWLLDPSNVH